MGTQIGTLVKLVRVLMLGPLVVGMSLIAPRLRGDQASPTRAKAISPFKLVPWFIVGFLVLAALRSFQLIPDGFVAPATKVASFLTIVSMAALGMGVDIRVLSSVGGEARFESGYTHMDPVMLAVICGSIRSA